MKFLKKKHLISIVLFVIFAVGFTIFVMKFKRKSDIEENKVVKNDSYDFLIYNTESELQEVLEKLADEYRNVSGIVPAVSLKDSEMIYDFNSETVPDIFMVKSFDEMKVQTQYGNVLDFMNASEKTFQEVVKGIPGILQAQVNEINNCGIPLTVRGAGFAVNQKLISSIFGESTYKNVINDLSVCSYEDFENFIKNIKSPFVTLNGKEYAVNQSASKILTSAFSFYTEFPISKMLNSAFALNFQNQSDLSNSENLSNMQDEFSSWLRMLDLISSNCSISRGSSFVDLEKHSKLNAIKEFSEGKSLFLVADDKDYDEIKSNDSETASHLTFIPFKFPYKKTDSKNLNACLTVYCPYYFMINAKSSKPKMAQDFLTWVMSSPVARKLLLEEAGCVSYDIRDTGTIQNTLSRSAVNYLQSENAIIPVFQGIKKSWLNSVSQQLIKRYFNTSNWNSYYYSNFDTYCRKKWEQ